MNCYSKNNHVTDKILAFIKSCNKLCKERQRNAQASYSKGLNVKNIQCIVYYKRKHIALSHKEHCIVAQRGITNLTHWNYNHKLEDKLEDDMHIFVILYTF